MYLDPGNPTNPPVQVDAAPWGVAPGRTYIIPDDWYANHGLAPGDARKPQQAIEGSQKAAAAWGDATSGKLVPTPPVRGYFGRPPMHLVRDAFGRKSLPLPHGLTTRSPFAVSDMMPGVHGLGDDKSVEDILGKMNKDMKKLMMEQAATSTAISIGLAVIPVVGWAASAVYSVVQGIVGSQNEREARQVMADTETKAHAIVSKYQSKLSAAQDDAFAAESPAAVQLAATCSSLEGLSGFGIHSLVKNTVLFAINPVAPLIKPAQRIVKKVAPKSVSHVTEQVAHPAEQLDKGVDHGIDVLSGQAAVEKAEKARTQILARVESDMSAQYATAVRNMQLPAFRNNLRTQIAIKLRADPSIQQTLVAQCGLMPTTGQYVDPITGKLAERVDAGMPTGSKVAPWAGLAAAAATIMALGLGHK